MICYDMVRRSAPVWSCGSCFSIFHLPCIRKWVRSPASAASPAAADPASASPSWRCAGCQFVYDTPTRDLAYTCFCGRRRDPPNDHFLTPHSCGEPCSRPVERAEPPGAKGKEDADATRCPHVCVLQCHPGPCPPCKAFAPDRPCPCGKQIIVRRCAKPLVEMLAQALVAKLLVDSLHHPEAANASPAGGIKWEKGASWEPKHFVIIHATPKSKPPARILGSKAGAPVTASHPYFDPLVDMDPRVIVAMLDLPRDADVNALVLRFGGECELVWLNDKSAIAVFNDLSRAATALRRLDYGSAYQGAAMFVPSSAQASSSGNVWIGGQKDGGLAARSNPWKKPASAEPDMSSGDRTGILGHARAPGWRGANTTSRVMGTPNRWNVLESDAAASSVPGGEQRPTPCTIPSYSAIPNTGNAGPPVTKLQPNVDVDDWEEACE